MKFTDNAVKFYLDISESERWAIREFIRANAGDNDVADELLTIENYINDKREKLIELMAIAPNPVQLLNPEYERFVKSSSTKCHRNRPHHLAKRQPKGAIIHENLRLPPHLPHTGSGPRFTGQFGRTGENTKGGKVK